MGRTIPAMGYTKPKPKKPLSLIESIKEAERKNKINDIISSVVTFLAFILIMILAYAYLHYGTTK